MEEEGGEKTQSDQGRASSDSQSVEENNAQKSQPVSYQHPPPYPNFILNNKSKIAIVIGVIIVVSFVIFSLIFIFVINPGLEKPGVFIDLDITHPDNLGINVIIDSGTVLSLMGVANLKIT